MDLVLHSFPKKLFLLLPVHCGNPETAVQQAHVVLGRFIPTNDFRVVAVGKNNEQSVASIRKAVADLGVMLTQ
jgi:hypothetical protein